jgi:hypothetical protein
MDEPFDPMLSMLLVLTHDSLRLVVLGVAVTADPDALAVRLLSTLARAETSVTARPMKGHAATNT